jgi:NACalpha-BTF3-like transcription factor
MKTQIIKKDNRQAILIAKSELEKYSISEKLEINSDDHFIIIQQAKLPREDWANAFKTMNENGDDKLILEFDH